MKMNPEIWIIVAIVVIFLLVFIVKAGAEWLLNLIMRGILGTVAIYFINDWLNNMGLSLGVGVNLITVLTSGVLGFPGLLALYGIGFYKSL